MLKSVHLESKQIPRTAQERENKFWDFKNKILKKKKKERALQHGREKAHGKMVKTFENPE